jgi:hypothetical protein
MKKYILVLTFFITAKIVAQPNANYTGKAKTFVDNFWKLADDIKKTGTAASN